MPTGNPQRGFEDFGAFNPWAPTVVAGTGGSKWSRALPGQKGGLHNVPPPPTFPTHKNVEMSSIPTIN